MQKPPNHCHGHFAIYSLLSSVLFSNFAKVLQFHVSDLNFHQLVPLPWYGMVWKPDIFVNWLIVFGDAFRGVKFY